MKNALTLPLTLREARELKRVLDTYAQLTDSKEHRDFADTIYYRIDALIAHERWRKG